MATLDQQRLQKKNAPIESAKVRPVRLGIIGCGTIGKVHLSAAMDFPWIDLCAVADLQGDLARQMGRQFNVRSVYDQSEALLDDSEVEAVVLAMPASNRTEVARQAFSRGKHVLVEKPAAMNVAELRSLLEVRGDRVGACCSSRHRFLPSASAATAFFATGKLGTIRTVHCRALTGANPRPTNPPPPWRLSKAWNGGGILPNWGVYDLDYLLGITGWSLRPRQVFAQTWPLAKDLEANAAPGSDAETHMVALVRCEGGETLFLERGEYMAHPTDKAWQIIGDRGSLDLNLDIGPTNQVIYHSVDPVGGLKSETVWEGDEGDYKIVHYGPIRDFAEAIRFHRPPKTSLEQAFLIQKISDAIYASAEKGTVVEINP